MIDEDHGAKVLCNFCQSEYNYTEDDLRALLSSNKDE